MYNNRTILIITNTFFLKAGNQSLYNTVVGLIKNGFKVEVITCAKGDEYLPYNTLHDRNFCVTQVDLYSRNIYKWLAKNRYLAKIVDILRNRLKKDKSKKTYILNNKKTFFINDNFQWKGIITLLEFTIKANCVVKKTSTYDVIWGYERVGAIISNYI